MATIAELREQLEQRERGSLMTQAQRELALLRRRPDLPEEGYIEIMRSIDQKIARAKGEKPAASRLARTAIITQ